MANVIDRLRVQGNPAPRNLPSQPESGLSRLGKRGVGGLAERHPHPDQQTVQFVLKHSHVQNRDTDSGRLRNQAARRLEHLQRIQLANHGLSSMDLRHADLPGKQFMLRGKPASADTLLHRSHALQQQEPASTSASKSGQRLTRSSKSHADVNGVLPPTRSDLRESQRNRSHHHYHLTPAINATNGHSEPQASSSTTSYPVSSTLPLPQPSSTCSSAAAYFMLANPSTLVNHPSTRSAGHPRPRTLHGGDGRGETSAPAGTRPAGSGSSGQGAALSAAMAKRQAYQLHSAGSAASFELTGRQVVTPRSMTGYEDGLVNNIRDYYTRSPRLRSGFRDKSSALRDRRSPGLRDATMEHVNVDPQSLRQCLHVQQTSNPDGPAHDKLRLSHYAHQLQARSEGKVNYNNPYRQKTKERRALPENERRYIFDSVASYIHFNKIYPNMKDSPGAAGNPANSSSKAAAAPLSVLKEGQPNVPHLQGFPRHCTDTILLKMMFEMNRPGAVHGIGLGHQAAGAPSLKSSISNKYSDVGRHRDLEEFMVQGETPSSHRQHQPQHTQRSVIHGSPPNEADEENKGSNANDGDKEEQRREADEDDSTLLTATTPGRRPLGEDEDDDDADDEASQWNAKGGRGKRGGKGKRIGRSGRGGRVSGVSESGDGGYDTDSTVTNNQ